MINSFATLLTVNKSAAHKCILCCLLWSDSVGSDTKWFASNKCYTSVGKREFPWTLVRTLKMNSLRTKFSLYSHSFLVRVIFDSSVEISIVVHRSWCFRPFPAYLHSWALQNWSALKRKLGCENFMIVRIFNKIFQLQATGVEMWGANTMLWIGREDIRANVLRPFVECALIKDCMAPVGSQLFCRFSEVVHISSLWIQIVCFSIRFSKSPQTAQLYSPSSSYLPHVALCWIMEKCWYVFMGVFILLSFI